ncbi:ABC-type transporter, integral membrane subunit [Thalassoporum mexicanum PCC 7367]|uniref:metal ABC transporter permease n=1 Tax=Thalassoporum mexicanum TaxID=3457544 RepID=UPI00029F8746|nr:metal ABC transporter permease [Pseudanabaena sp. PCC 7367]AFY71160.1 ABC-type transporter, integral membrane subunit [Pseudanabaena sp. PCC 7367]
MLLPSILFSKLIEPFSAPFMQRSLSVGVMVGLICAVVGTYLMVQRLALLGDAISHSVLPGMAIAYALEASIVIGAFIAGILSTIVINWIRARSDIKEDAAMGIVFSAFFALGIILITIIQKNEPIDLNHFLFGNILAVTFNDLRDTAIIAVAVIAVIILLYKELLFYSFDPLGAQANGLPINLLNLGLMVLIALTIVASLKIVGVVLVLALLIAPGATAYLLVPRFHQVMLLAAGFGVIASLSGIYVSYFTNIPSGPAIVLFAFGLFILALLFSPSQGVLTNPHTDSGSSPLWQEIKSLLPRR